MKSKLISKQHWNLKTIDEIKSNKKNAISMGPFGSNITRDNFVPQGVPVIRGTNLVGNEFNENNFVFITEEKADQLKASNAFPEDIVLTHRGTLGQVAIIPKNCKFKRYVVSQSQMKFTSDPVLAYPLFVYYYLCSPEGQTKLLIHTSSTGVPAIARPLTSLKGIEIEFPDLSIQKKIGDILDMLHQKINLLKNENKILEQTIRSIFKSWFIDFDGQTEFVDSELGQIPKGWDVKPISFVCSSIDYGYTTSAKIEEIGPRFLRITDIVKDRISWNGVPFCEIDASDFKKYQLSNNDVVIARTGASTGDSKLIIDPPSSIFASYLIRLKIKPSFSSNYVASFISSKEYENYIDGVLGEKSAQPNANAKTLTACQMIIPAKELIKQFEFICNPIQNFIRNNEKKLENLKQIQDSFLPKLMSGELVN